jgi:ketosteroid isomerase-like protein
MSSPAPGTGPDEIVRQLYAAYQARDWPASQPLLHPDVTVEVPSSGDLLTSREELMSFNRDFPEPWGDMTVQAAFSNGTDRAAAEITVNEEGQLAWRMAAFWQLKDGLLWRGTEYWVRARPPEVG